MDTDLRNLERAVQATPDDKALATQLAVARVRAGAQVAVAEAHSRAPGRGSRQTNGRVYLWSVKDTPELGRKTRIAAARAVLQAVGIDPAAVTLTWDRHAGCSTCPCSPGYVIKRRAPVKTAEGLLEITARTRPDAAHLHEDIFGTVVAQPDETTEPKSEMEQIRDGLGIRNGGR